MGNFCTYARFNLSGVNGVAPLFVLRLQKDGTFVDGKVVSTKQLGEGGPVLDAAKGALKQVSSLTKTDLPELKLQIKDDGSFYFN